MKKIEELLMKLKALSDRGVGGEKENATMMLSRLMDKHNITTEDLESMTRIKRAFRYKTEEKQLLRQVIAHVMGSNCAIYRWSDNRNEVLVECTKVEFLEIQTKFNFYKVELKETLDIAYKAFVHKNEILPPQDGLPDEEMTPERMKEIQKIAKMMRGIDKSHLHKHLKE